MRTNVIIFILMAALIFLWQGGETTHSGTSSLLQDVMAQAKAAPAAGEAVYWGTLGEELLSLEELECLADRVAASLGIEPRGPRERLAEEGYNLVDIPGVTTSGIKGRVILQSVAPAAAGSSMDSDQGTFLLVQLKEEGGAGKVLELGERLHSLLGPFGARGELTLDVTAHLPGKLTGEEMSRIAEELLQGARAEVVEGMADKNLVSLTGYTPLLENYLTLGREKINLNVALRYDSHQEVTVLRLGVPLISGGY